MSGTLSALKAKITNTPATAGIGNLILEIRDGSTVVCRSDGGAADGPGYSDGMPNTNNSSSCTFDLFGSTMLALAPNASKSRTITVKNAGTMPAKTFTLTPNTCTQQKKNSTDSGDATDLCAKLNIKVMSGSTTVVADKSLTAFKNAGAVNILAALGQATVPVAGTTSLTFTVTRTSAADATYRNLQATLPVTMVLTS